jgi:hypothetical protein
VQGLHNEPEQKLMAIGSKIIATLLYEAHRRQVEEAMGTLAEGTSEVSIEAFTDAGTTGTP